MTNILTTISCGWDRGWGEQFFTSRWWAKAPFRQPGREADNRIKVSVITNKAEKPPTYRKLLIKINIMLQVITPESYRRGKTEQFDKNREWIDKNYETIWNLAKEINSLSTKNIEPFRVETLYGDVQFIPKKIQG